MKKVNATLNSGEAKPALHTAKISTAANIISSISVLIAAVAVVVGMYPQSFGVMTTTPQRQTQEMCILNSITMGIGKYKAAIYRTKPHLPHG